MELKFKFLVFTAIILLNISCSKHEPETIENPTVNNPVFYKGMDLSFQMELENLNLDYKDIDNNPINLLDFSKQKGCNLVRLKLWHSPNNYQNTLEKLKLYALKLKQRNINFVLDIHYSDTWADPSHQNPPVSWQNLSVDQLKTEVYIYTKEVMTQLKTQGTLPVFVQIGNETDSGFLWNFGKVWNQFSNNWNNYSDLIKKGIEAVRKVNGKNTKIILHHSNAENAQYFFNELAQFNLDFDVIGLSYYPQFGTKDLLVLQSKLDYLASNFNKEIMMVEVAYPFTFDYADNLNNFIGDQSQILSNYPASTQGQKDFLIKINSIIKRIPNNKGIGWIYWAPDWIAFSGNQSTSTEGSSWENQCLFDFNHKALPAFDTFNP